MKTLKSFGVTMNTETADIAGTTYTVKIWNTGNEWKLRIDTMGNRDKTYNNDFSTKRDAVYFWEIAKVNRMVKSDIDGNMVYIFRHEVVAR